MLLLNLKITASQVLLINKDLIMSLSMGTSNLRCCRIFLTNRRFFSQIVVFASGIIQCMTVLEAIKSPVGFKDGPYLRFNTHTGKFVFHTPKFSATVFV